MKYIPLTQGKFAIVDDEDYDWLMQWKWCAFRRIYKGVIYGFTAVRHCRCPFRPNKSYIIFMHRMIMSTPQGMDTDHINADALDNRKCNLRICTHSENMQNSRSFYGSSKFKGVYWDKTGKKWRPQITKNRVLYNLTRCKSEIEAARAYDAKAKELFGDFARLNFPE